MGIYCLYQEKTKPVTLVIYLKSDLRTVKQTIELPWMLIEYLSYVYARGDMLVFTLEESFIKDDSFAGSIRKYKSTVIVYSLRAQRVVKKVENIPNKVLSCCLTDNYKYLFVATDSSGSALTQYRLSSEHSFVLHTNLCLQVQGRAAYHPCFQMDSLGDSLVYTFPQSINIWPFPRSPALQEMCLTELRLSGANPESLNGKLPPDLLEKL